jgi:hypothetical protein
VCGGSGESLAQYNQGEAGCGEGCGHADAVGQDQEYAKPGPAQCDGGEQDDECGWAGNKATGDAHGDKASAPAWFVMVMRVLMGVSVVLTCEIPMTVIRVVVMAVVLERAVHIVR